MEDWFQVENFKEYIPISSWPSCELRVEKNTHRLLDILDSFEPAGKPESRGQTPKRRHNKNNLPYETHANDSETNFVRVNNEQPSSLPASQPASSSRIKATYFSLGWIAEKVPHLIREIHARGHEVASHGYYHRLNNKQSPQDLRIDLSDSKKLLEDIIGASVYGYRAPNFAVNDEILKIIEECGYLYDSSFNSFSMHGRYGHVNLAQKDKTGIAVRISGNFWELPISNLSVGNYAIPWGGGAYFRLIPFRLFRLGVKSNLQKQNAYLFYIHPWELDPQQPRVKNVSIFTRFRHYSNLSRAESKLSSFIGSFRESCFITCHQYLRIHQCSPANCRTE